jgi:hypothetical protein
MANILKAIGPACFMNYLLPKTILVEVLVEVRVGSPLSLHTQYSELIIFVHLYFSHKKILPQFFRISNP